MALCTYVRPSSIPDPCESTHCVRQKVSCKHGHIVDRDSFQECLSQANPRWRDFAAELEASGHQPRTNPDGDVELDGVSYNDFVVPDCPVCLLENRVNAVVSIWVAFELVTTVLMDFALSTNHR
jgi:NAD-dependent deacetylase sirtuin 4